MIIRKAKLSDLKNIMSMYESCVKGMIDSDIDQWDTTYPNSNIIKEDINAKTYFIAIKKNKLIGGINIDSNQDKTYLTINWEDTSNLFFMVFKDSFFYSVCENNKLHLNNALHLFCL